MTDQEQKQIISENLTRLIERSGKEQRQIAFDLDEKPTTFNSWVKGKAIPAVTTIQKIARYFNVGLEDIVDKQPQETDALKGITGIQIKPIDKKDCKSEDINPVLVITRDEQELIVEYRNANGDTRNLIRRLLKYHDLLLGKD